MCGQEKIKLKEPSDFKLNIIAKPTNKKISNPLSELFEVDFTESLQKLGDCPIDGFEICSDIKCTKLLKTHPHLSLTNSNYEIVTSKAF